MASWGEFVGADPAFGHLAQERIERDGLVLVGTLRRNGWPRISPVEPLIVDGRLYLGMMSQSRKALDLRRDPRCVVHTHGVGQGGHRGGRQDLRQGGRRRGTRRRRSATAAPSRRGSVGDPRATSICSPWISPRSGYFVVADGGHRTRTWRPS